MTLTEFLLARIAEDEAVAKTAIEDDGGEDGFFEDAYEDLIRPPSGVGIASGGFGEAAARMIVRSTPRRLLAECEAKRRIIAHIDSEIDRFIDMDLVPNWYSALREEWELIVALLALPYADHPDYREEWQPSAAE